MLSTRIQFLRVENILDDEFVIELDDSPPFNWIRQSSSRFMSCDIKKKLDSMTVHADGNALLISKMVADLVGGEKLRIDGSFLSTGEGTNVIITYSGELRKAITLMESSEEKGIVISSGGVVKNIARNKGWDYIPLPKGYPTRFLFPEVFGCLLSLLGRRIEIPGLADFIDSIMPSSIIKNNLAKQLAYKLGEDKTALFYDHASAGLAERLRDDFAINAGINLEVHDIDHADLSEIEIGSKTFIISLAKRVRNIKGIAVSSLPYDNGSVDGYVKNVLIGDISSLYVGLLRKKEIEFLDRTLE
jgi:hypothetical protein